MKTIHNNSTIPVIVIVGPTASGKSDAAVLLAKKINGAVISADSRQVYKGLDIGSGKITKKEKGGVPHYGLDIVSPKKIFTAHDFKKYTQKKIADIMQDGKIPIVVGGTGFYIDIALGRMSAENVPPNPKIRKQLESYSTDKLFLMLKKIAPSRAETIDIQNPRRLVRALEIALTQKKNKKAVPSLSTINYPLPTILWFGIKKEKEELHRLIERRLEKRWKGILKETKKLHSTGISWKRLYDFGLEYRYSALVLQKKLSAKEAYDQLLVSTKHYAKRQMTWFKRNKEIQWVSNNKNIVTVIKNELKKRPHRDLLATL
jgi:tRNA dimethylallyltransferase